MFYFCSMASDADMTESDNRLLGGLAELSLAMARDLQAAVAATRDPRDLVRLVGAFAKVGRCLRLAVALRARLARGEALAPATRAQAGRDAPLDAELADETERPETVRPETVRAESLDHESLYERLPDGDPSVIARGLAVDLIHTARGPP